MPITQKQTQLLQSFLVAIAVIFGISLITPLTSLAATKKAPDPTTGYLLLYSQGGKFKKAIIKNNSGDKTAKCGSKKFYDSKGVYKDISVGLSSGGKNKSGKVIATKVKCTAGTYSIQFFKKSATKHSGEATIGLAASKCAFVHNYGVTRTEAVVNDRCVGDDDPSSDTIVKYTPALTAAYSPNVITQGKKTIIMIEMKNPSGEAMIPEECAGTLTLGGNTAFAKQNKQLKLRYNGKTKTCQYKGVLGSSTTKVAAIGSFTQTAQFEGNKFTHAVGVGYPYTVVADPAKTAAAAASAKPTGPVSVGNERITKDAKNKFRITTRAVVKNFPNCVDNAPGVTVTAFKYKKETGDKPHDVENSKKPTLVSIKAAKVGKNCNFTIVHTYPAPAKKMDVKHQFSITVDGKVYAKKTNKLEVGN